MARGGAAVAIGAARARGFVFGGGRGHCQVAGNGGDANIRYGLYVRGIGRVEFYYWEGWEAAIGEAHQLHECPVTCRPTVDDEHGRRLYPPPHIAGSRRASQASQATNTVIQNLYDTLHGRRPLEVFGPRATTLYWDSDNNVSGHRDSCAHPAFVYIHFPYSLPALAVSMGCTPGGVVAAGILVTDPPSTGSVGWWIRRNAIRTDRCHQSPTR